MKQMNGDIDSNTNNTNDIQITNTDNSQKFTINTSKKE